MPIKTQSDLPVLETLERENIFVMDEFRAMHQDIRPLKVGILNLMPLKQETELQMLRLLSNSPLQVDVTFLHVKSHVSQNTSASHMNQFYTTFDQIKEQKLDGLIITGAPVENLEYQEVDYWDEMCEIMEWTKTNVTSTMHVCWGAMAGLFYHYGIPKYQLDKKISGVYPHNVMNRKEPLVRGFDDIFMVPHSRYSQVKREDILQHENLMIMAESDEAGVFLILDKSGKQIFLLGHPEYDRYTLHEEYVRDTNKGINSEIPVNYYPNNDPTQRPLLQWRAQSSNLYSNWLNYYVYQVTPFEL